MSDEQPRHMLEHPDRSEVPGLDQPYPRDWVSYRVMEKNTFLLPPVGIVWREMTRETLAIHLAVKPWIRQVDGRVVSLQSGRQTVCDIVMADTEAWYGLMTCYPKGWDLVPAKPRPDAPACLKCLGWLDKLRMHHNALVDVFAAPSRIQERKIKRPSFQGKCEPISVMEILRRGAPSNPLLEVAEGPQDDAVTDGPDD